MDTPGRLIEHNARCYPNEDTEACIHQDRHMTHGQYLFAAIDCRHAPGACTAHLPRHITMSCRHRD